MNQAANTDTSIPPIVPVILSGGMGSRLWPLSREGCPKQFLQLDGSDYSLIQNTVRRVMDHNGLAEPVVISNDKHRFLVIEQMAALGLDDVALILEPCARNTAPAIAAAAYYIRKHYGESACMLVLPSDHIIQNREAFLQGVERAAKLAGQGKLVTFGITPEHPETGYGYIHYGAADPSDSRAFAVAEFVEKPDAATAQTYVDSGEYGWNSGMFMFQADSYLSELGDHAPDIHAQVAAAMEAAQQEGRKVNLDAEAFAASPSDSIDYAVMEHTRNACVVPLECGWSDAGAWDSIWKLNDKDDNGNVVIGNAYTLDARNNYISCADGPKVAAIGVENLAIISTADTVMVTTQQCAQDVKTMVNLIKGKEPELIANHRRVYRPWGYYDSINSGRRHQVKRIHVRPGAQLSLQMHHHRAEHWIVVRGTALVERDGESQLLSENQSIYIPLGTKHRLENPGKIELDLIEVQSGAYLGEDDIVRFDDKYGRAK